MSVPLADGRKARALTVLDVFTQEALALRADARFTAGMMARILAELKTLREVPTSLRVDSGPEFAGKLLDLWAYFYTVVLDFSRPGKPTDKWMTGGGSPKWTACTVSWGARPPEISRPRRPGSPSRIRRR